jgi:PEP-CTERM/exosortase A-associated glycosyltransferase
MKILHVLQYSLPTLYGYTVRADCILRAQRQLGLDVVGITGSLDRASGNDLVNDVRFYRTQAEVKAGKPGFREWNLYRNLKARLLEVAAAERPTILHVHSPVYNGFATLSVARRLGIPCVYEMRAVWEDAAVDAKKFSTSSPIYSAARWLETQMLRRADAVVTICEGLRNEVLSRGVPTEKVFVVSNAVEADQFLPVQPDASVVAELGWTEPKYIFGFLGSLYDYEGVEDLVAVIPRVLAAAPHARFLIVGSGEREAAIRAQIEQLGVGNAVLHRARVPHTEVKRLYSAVDCLVYPRRKVRLTDLVTPLKPLEAMSMEKAVVASDVGGHRELVEHGRTGLLYTAGDASALTAALCRLAADPAVGRQMAEAGRQFVLSKRNWRVVSENYIPAYTWALANHGRL